MKACREGVRAAAVVVPRSRHPHRSRWVPRRVTAISPPLPLSASSGRCRLPRRCRGCLPAAVVLDAPPRCHRRRGCMVGHCGRGCLPARSRGRGCPPRSSSWSYGPPPRSSLWLWVPPRSSSSPWVPLRPWVPPPVVLMAMWCLPARCRGRGCLFARPRGHVVPPWSSSWPCGASPVVAVGAPSRPCGHVVPPSHPCGHVLAPARPRPRVVPPRSSSWPCGAPLALVAVGAPPLVLVIVGAPLVVLAVWWPPRLSSWPCGAPPLVLVAVGASRSFSRPWVRTCVVSPQPLPYRCSWSWWSWLWWSFCGSDGGDGDEADELSKERLHILGRHMMIRPINRPHFLPFPFV